MFCLLQSRTQHTLNAIGHCIICFVFDMQITFRLKIQPFAFLIICTSKQTHKHTIVGGYSCDVTQDRIFKLSRVPLKSRAKYQFVTQLISYLSVLLSTVSEHNGYYSASVVSTLFNNFHANSWSYCPLFFIFGGSNCDGNDM